jgi:hypothetical protein
MYMNIYVYLFYQILNTLCIFGSTSFCFWFFTDSVFFGSTGSVTSSVLITLVHI